ITATPTPPRQIIFDPTPEIYATDSAGSFTFPLLVASKAFLGTSAYDEVRFVFSIWHPSGQRTIDLDRAYVELRAAFDPDEDHWRSIAEINAVVPTYAGGGSLDGWIAPPIPGSSSAFAVVGSGFEPRARLQVRASAYFVA